MYDMDKINVLLGLPQAAIEDAKAVEFKDDDYPDEPVSIATEIPQTTNVYEVSPFMLFCNGHDGSLSCRMARSAARSSASVLALNSTLPKCFE